MGPDAVGIRNMGKYSGTWETVKFDKKQCIYMKSARAPVSFQCLMNSPDFSNLLAQFPVPGLKLICENNDDESQHWRIMAGETVLYECENVTVDAEGDPDCRRRKRSRINYALELVGDFQKVSKVQKKWFGIL